MRTNRETEKERTHPTNPVRHHGSKEMDAINSPCEALHQRRDELFRLRQLQRRPSSQVPHHSCTPHMPTNPRRKAITSDHHHHHHDNNSSNNSGRQKQSVKARQDNAIKEQSAHTPLSYWRLTRAGAGREQATAVRKKRQDPRPHEMTNAERGDTLFSLS